MHFFGRASPSRHTSVRKVLSVAVQYSRLSSANLELLGTHKDPYMLRDVLVQLFDYKTEDFTILMDDDEHLQPTSANIRKAMRELLSDAQPGDHFVFHFSGHGGQVENVDGTEKDGLDEVIWPVDVDYRANGDFSNYISDNEIHDILVEHVPPGAHFTMVFDCCHSGTMADLPYSSEDIVSNSGIATPAPSTEKNVRFRGTQMIDDMTRIEPSTFVPLHHCDVESWSACRDDETALGDEDGGVFMRAFTAALRANPRATHDELLELIKQNMTHLISDKRMRRRRRQARKSTQDIVREHTPEYDCDQPIEEVRGIPVEL